MIECNIIGRGETPANAIEQHNQDASAHAALRDYVDQTVTQKSKWTELARITTSGTWTVPAGVYRIGVFLLGGGASGAKRDSTTSRDDSVSGGPSGFVNNAILDVTPGQQIPVVIGSGGDGGAVVGEIMAGGDTEFGTIVAEGGGKDGDIAAGAQPATPIGDRFFSEKYYTSARSGADGLGAFIGSTGDTSSKLFYFPVVSRVGLKCNIFDLTMRICSAGAGGTRPKGQSYASKMQTQAPETDLGRGGAYKESATGYGNGGGGVLGKATPGSGSPGIVIIYI